MNKKLAITLIVTAFIVGIIGGLIVGSRVVAYFYGRMTSSLGSSEEAGRVSLDVSVLKRLRANNVTNSIDFLEIDLDGALIGLGDWLNTNSTSFDRQMQLKALQNAKDYRNKFPHTNPYPELNQAISNTFSLVDMETNK